MNRFDEVYFDEAPFDSWITYVLRRIAAFTTPLRDWIQTTGVKSQSVASNLRSWVETTSIKSWAQFTGLTRRIMRR